MRITRKQLRQIIQEEAKILSEAPGDDEIFTILVDVEDALVASAERTGNNFRENFNKLSGPKKNKRIVQYDIGDVIVDITYTFKIDATD